MEGLNKYALLLPLCLLIICCNNQNKEQLDEQYLNSDSFSEFEEKSNEEIALKENQLKGLPAHLEQLPQCTMNDRSFPFTINQEELPALLESQPDCDFNTNAEQTRFTLKLLGGMDFVDIDLYWVIVNWEAVYTDQEIIVATFRDGNLLNFEKVGTFQKNLKQDIATETIAQSNDANVSITSITNRKIMYPIEQNNTVFKKYLVDSQGKIQEQ